MDDIIALRPATLVLIGMSRFIEDSVFQHEIK